MKQIKLTENEVEYLSAFVKKGRKNARELTRAHVLLQINTRENRNGNKRNFGN